MTVPPAGGRTLLLVAPSSLNWTLPFASKIVPFLSRSVHARVSVWPASGFTDEARPSASCARNLPTDVLSAVLPLPNRS